MSERLTDGELDEAFAYAHGSLRLTAALSELRASRARDLSAEDLEALGWFRDSLGHGVKFGAVSDPKALAVRALAVLDRLLAGGGK